MKTISGRLAPKSLPASLCRLGACAALLALWTPAGAQVGPVFLRDVVVKNTVPGFAAGDKWGDAQPSIAINPANVNKISIVTQSGTWAANAPIWCSQDGGITWTQKKVISAPGIAEIPGMPGPSAQTIDYRSTGTLTGSFLANDNPKAGTGNIYSGVITDPLTAAWQWNGNPAQVSNPNSMFNTVQPWLLTLPGMTIDYVAYNNNNVTPAVMRVAVSGGQSPPGFAAGQDLQVGTSSADAGAGLRLGMDPTGTTVYALWQDNGNPLPGGPGFGGGPRSIRYALQSKSVFSGNWSINNSVGQMQMNGLTLDTGLSTQVLPKFGGVNSLRGGVDALAVRPTALPGTAGGSVYCVYGMQALDAQNKPYDGLYIVRVDPINDGANNIDMTVQTPLLFSPAGKNAALPAVAVIMDGTIGVLYYSIKGTWNLIADPPAKPELREPEFIVHLALLKDAGNNIALIQDIPLLTFVSAQADLQTLKNILGAPIRAKAAAIEKQCVLGNYVQLKANQQTFYGVFTTDGTQNGLGRVNVPNGNTAAGMDGNGNPIAHDPIFFRVTPNQPSVLLELLDDQDNNLPFSAPFTGSLGSVCLHKKTIFRLRIWNTGILGAQPLTVSSVTRTAASIPSGIFVPKGAPTPMNPLVIQSGAFADVQIECTPTALGLATAIVDITCNDPNFQPDVALSFNCTGIGPSLMATLADGNDFNAPLGGSSSSVLKLANTGSCNLVVTHIVTSSQEFVPSQFGPIQVPPGVPVKITYKGTSIGNQKKANITIFSNDPLTPVTVIPVTGTTLAPPANPPMGGGGGVNLVPTVQSAWGQVEYAYAPYHGAQAGPPTFGYGHFIRNGQVLISPGGGFPSLGPGRTVFTASGSLFPHPLHTWYFGRPPILAAQTTFAASPLGGIYWAPPTYVRDAAVDGIASINISRGVATFNNLTGAPRVNVTAGYGLSGFVPTGAQGAACASAIVNDTLVQNGTPNNSLIPPAIITVTGKGPAPGVYINGQRGQAVYFTPVSGGWNFAAWVSCTGPFFPGRFPPALQPGASWSIDVTYTLLFDPGIEMDFNPSVIPTNEIPDVGVLPIGQTEPPPADAVSLAITNAGNDVQVSWPASQQPYDLQASMDLSTDIWSSVTEPVATSGGLNTVVVATNVGTYVVTEPNGSLRTNIFLGSNNLGFFRLANANPPLSVEDFEVLNGDYTVAGAGLQGTGVGGVATATLSIANIPDGSSVTTAYLYWATRGGDGSEAFLLSDSGANTNLIGTPLGTNASDCSPLPDIVVYWADITAALPLDGTNVIGDANYFITLPDSGNPAVGPSTEGVSLLLIYENPALSYKAITVYDGAYSIQNPGDQFLLALQSFGQVAYSNATAKITHIVADAQPGLGDTLYFDGVPIGNTNSAFDGAQGPRWDNPTYNVSSLVHPADTVENTSVKLPANGPNCLTWGAVVFGVDTPPVATGPVYVYNPTNMMSSNSQGASFTVYAFSDSAGSLTPIGANVVNPGTTLNFMATPNPSFQVNQWVLDDAVAQSGGTSFTLANIQSDHYLLVDFAPATNTADLGVSATSSPELLLVGEALTNSILVTNAGPSEADNTVLLCQFSTNVTISFVDSTQGTILTNAVSVECDLGTLPAGGTATLSLVVSPLTDGILTNQITVSSAEADPYPEDDSYMLWTTVEQPPFIVIQPQAQTANQGSNVVLSVTAGGTPPLGYQWLFADSVVLPDATNATLELTNATIEELGDYTVVVTNAVGEAISTTVPVDINPRFELDTTNSPDGSLGPGGPVYVFLGGSQTFTASPSGGSAVDFWYLDGDYAQVGGDSFTITNVQSDHTVGVGFGDTVDLGVTILTSSGFVDVGSNILYAIEVTNNAANTATDVEVTDVLPSELTFVSATSTQGTCVNSSGTVTCSLGTLASGETAIITLVVIVSVNDVDTISNTATVTADQTDLRTVNTSSTAYTDTTQALLGF